MRAKGAAARLLRPDLPYQERTSPAKPDGDQSAQGMAQGRHYHDHHRSDPPATAAKAHGPVSEATARELDVAHRAEGLLGAACGRKQGSDTAICNRRAALPTNQ